MPTWYPPSFVQIVDQSVFTALKVVVWTVLMEIPSRSTPKKLSSYHPILNNAHRLLLHVMILIVKTAMQMGHVKRAFLVSNFKILNAS